MRLIRYFLLGMMQVLGNLGLTLGFTLAVIMLLRPITNRLLRPKYRVAFWMAAWMMGWGGSFYELAGFISVLPVTFRGWITPWREGDLGVPEYLPELNAAGDYAVALPGGLYIPFSVTEWMLYLMAALVLVGFVGVIWWSGREESKLKKLSRQGELLEEAWHRAHGIDPDEVQVRIMPDLPASFVCRVGVGQHNVCLQKELPEEQMELVLRHELAHIRQHHVWAKGIVVAMLCLYWWNPICWLAYRLTSRDIELACDEMVLKGLDEKQRRDYARTLVELASGQHLWGGLTCFGECDAEIRVRRTVNWKRERLWTGTLVWPALILAFLFLFTSPTEGTASRAARWEDYAFSSAPVTDLRERLDDPELEIQEIWMRDKNLLVLTDDGEWWLSHFSLSRSGVRAGTYYSNGWNRVEDPGKYQFVQIGP